MATLIILTIYIFGVWMAYFQLHNWGERNNLKDEDYQTIFMLSTLSWFIFPIYGIIKLLNMSEEE